MNDGITAKLIGKILFNTKVHRDLSSSSYDATAIGISHMMQQSN